MTACIHKGILTGIACFAAIWAGGAEAAEKAPPDITGFWTQKDTGPAPDMALTAWAREGLAAMQTKRDEAALLCLSRGFFGLDPGSPPPIDILYGENEVTIVGNDYRTFARHIYLGREHLSPDDFAPNNNGNSIGHWEGDTLVVDTISYDTETGIGPQYAPHSEALHVVERFRLADGGATLVHEMTMTDPMALEEAYSVTTQWTRTPDATPVKLLCKPRLR